MKMKLNFLQLSLITLLGIFIMVSCKEKDPFLNDDTAAEKKKTTAVKKEQPKKDTAKKETPAPKPKEEPKPEPKTKVYVVKEGDWLYKLSRKEYGTAMGWEAIYENNKEKINNPDLIFPGQELIIPEYK